jgi:hypothetical protein
MSTGELVKHYNYVLPDTTPGFINSVVYPAIYSERATGNNERFGVSEKLQFFYESVNLLVFNGLISEIQTCSDIHTQRVNQGDSTKSTDQILSTYNRKILHTLYTVPLASIDLMTAESGVSSLAELRSVPDFENKIHAVMLHDIARFEQYLETEAFNDSIYDHGVKGGEKSRKVMLGDNARTSPFDFTEMMKVTEAVTYHNLEIIPEGVIDPELCEFVRNADKLALSREWLENGQFQVIKDNDRLQSGPVSSIVLGKFMRGERINHKDCISKMDKLVNRLAWLYDISSPAGLELMESEGHINNVFDGMLDLISNIEGVDEEFLTYQMRILDQIKYRIDSYLKRPAKPKAERQSIYFMN